MESGRELLRGILDAAFRRTGNRPVGAGNDYRFIARRLANLSGAWMRLSATVVVPVYNRSQILAKTLAALCRQEYPRSLFDVVVADDGSSDRPEEVVDNVRGDLDISIVRQEDRGFRAAAARNLGLRHATGDVIVALDADMLAPPGFLCALLRWFHVYDGPLMVLGYQRHVNTDHLSPEDIRDDFEMVRRLGPRKPHSIVRPLFDGSADWRLRDFWRSKMLREHPAPYMTAAGGNVAYRRRDALALSGYCEDFQNWGGEDDEFAYRMVRRGAYIVPEPRALAYHQEHPPAVDRARHRKRTRTLVRRKIPYVRGEVSRSSPPGLSARSVIRALLRRPPERRDDMGQRDWEVPKVSLCIFVDSPGAGVRRSIDSALAQRISDMEICVCYPESEEPWLRSVAADQERGSHIRWISPPRQAIEMCRGEYILCVPAGADLLPNAALLLARELDRDQTASLVRARESGKRTARGDPAVAIERARRSPSTPPASVQMFRIRDWYRSGKAPVSGSREQEDALRERLSRQGRIRTLARSVCRDRPAPSSDEAQE